MEIKFSFNPPHEYLELYSTTRDKWVIIDSLNSFEPEIGIPYKYKDIKFMRSIRIYTLRIPFSKEHKELKTKEELIKFLSNR